MDKKTKVLIADDSAFMRKVLKDILQNIGFTDFIEAENGNDALAKYKSEKPGLVLLDVIMPEKDGLQVLKEIGTQTKVMIISAVGQGSMIEEAKLYGAVDYIVKPFDKEAVEAKIKNL